MSLTRKAYLLTTNEQSERTQFAANILKKIGFTVIFVQATPNKNPVVSNKISMMKIYKTIALGDDEYAYVFEDDIDIHEPITLEQIVAYEKISPVFFYLGVCIPRGRSTLKFKGNVIDNYKVWTISGNVRGLHAIGLSKSGSSLLYGFSKQVSKGMKYMDVILESFSRIHRANILRYDWENSKIKGHRGLFYQARDKFPTTIK